MSTILNPTSTPHEHNSFLDLPTNNELRVYSRRGKAQYQEEPQALSKQNQESNPDPLNEGDTVSENVTSKNTNGKGVR